MTEENNTHEEFDVEFFEGGKKKLGGGYVRYRSNEFYPKFSYLATWIKDSFNVQRVLDVGCAKGFLVKAFRDLGIETWGVDVSDYAISSAPDDIRPKLHKVDLNKDALPFEDDYFDFATFCGTIEYLTNHKHAICEINRVLGQGGGLYLTTIYKKDARDELRMNTHDKSYWVKEFRSNGFRISSAKLSMYLKEEYLPHIFARTQRNGHSIKFNFAKLLYQRGGYIGKQIVVLVAGYFGLTYGVLLFVKEQRVIPVCEPLI